MVMSSKITTRNGQQTADQNLIVGLQKHEQTLPSLVIGGTTYKAADIITVVQTLVNSAQAVSSSRATWQANLLADESARAKNKTFMSGLRQSLLVAFGSSVDVLADFGLKPHKVRAVVPPEEKAAAAAKARATRAARHTLGKKQKAQIKGTVAASPPQGDVTKVPATPASPPVASATPASTAPAAAPASTTHTGS
jgi:prophage tail gpP-like protein